MASDRLWINRDKIIILDSSAILMLFEFSINLEDELIRLIGKNKIVIPKQIIEELKILSAIGNGKKRKIAKPALDLVKKYEIINSEGKGDDSVLFLAKKFKGIVVTNDRELKNRLKKIGLHSIFLRGKQKLVLE